MKKLDWYIIGKFLTTFFFTLAIILVIVIVFDISEKIDDFMENDAPIGAIAMDYYLNFIPYFANLFSPLFIFISVIFFTSKMANNSEIIAILNSGMSYRRLMIPFIISSILLAMLSFIFGNFIIPSSNKKRIAFEEKYIENKKYYKQKDIHMQIEPGQYIYMQSYNTDRKIGYKFALENFKEGKLESKLRSKYIQYDTLTKKWQINNYQIRIFKNESEDIIEGNKIDTTINLHPSDFIEKKNLVETMNIFELNRYINKEELKGSEQIIYHKIEKHKRIAFPFASIILTIIAVSFSSRKVRGGIGYHLGIGLLIAFSYILFMQVSTTFATNSNLSPIIAVWIPNLIYTIIAYFSIRLAPK